MNSEQTIEKPVRIYQSLKYVRNKNQIGFLRVRMLEANPYTLIIKGISKYNIMVLTHDFKKFLYAETRQSIPTDKTRKVFKQRKTVPGIVGIIEGKVAEGATTGLPIMRGDICFDYNQWIKASRIGAVKAVRVNQQYNRRK